MVSRIAWHGASLLDKARVAADSRISPVADACFASRSGLVGAGADPPNSPNDQVGSSTSSSSTGASRNPAWTSSWGKGRGKGKGGSEVQVVRVYAPTNTLSYSSILVGVRRLLRFAHEEYLTHVAWTDSYSIQLTEHSGTMYDIPELLLSSEYTCIFITL